MKQPEIDPAKLTEYLIDSCDFLTRSDSGIRHCLIKRDGSCNVPFYARDLCPGDCPRLLVKTTLCDGASCKRVKRIMKKLRKG